MIEFQQYRLVDGARLRTPIAAQVVGEALERINVRNGGLTPHAVVDEARPPDSPLHEQFTWDDAKAAEERRLDQARQIIRSIAIIPSPSMGPTAPTEIRAFVSVGERPSQHYTSTYAALSNAELRQQVLDRALRELRQWRARYQAYTELAAIFEALDQAAA